MEFVYLLLDANYYYLPRLIHQLASSEIFMRIGNQSFKIPRNIFSNPGDTPNFFTVGFVGFFGSGIDTPKSQTFIRPPPLAPPTVPNRSSDLFADLLRVLQGGPVEVRNDEHRALLLKECKYYRFRNLEQRLIEYSIQQNRERFTEEIVINLDDVKLETLSLNNNPATVVYKRPFVDKDERELVLQIKGDEQVMLHRSSVPNVWTACFFDKAHDRMAKLAAHIGSNFGLDFGQVSHGYRVCLAEASILLNGEPVDILNTETGNIEGADLAPDSRKRRRVDSAIPDRMICQKSQWRLSQDESDCMTLNLLTAECTSGQKYKNRMRKFL